MSETSDHAPARIEGPVVNKPHIHILVSESERLQVHFERNVDETWTTCPVFEHGLCIAGERRSEVRARRMMVERRFAFTTSASRAVRQR